MKNRILVLFIVICSITLFTSCKRDFVKITGLDRNGTSSINMGPPDSGNPQISSINLTNNTLIISGSNLNSASIVRVTGPNSFDQTFNISSKTSNEIIAFAQSNISLVADAVFSVLVTNSFGEAIQTITLEIPQYNAEVGQILRWNGSNWIPADLGALTYSGNWNANLGSDPTNSPSAGEYFIVTTAGSTDLEGGIGTDSWDIGDWAIWNNTQVQWEKINNSTNVQSFNGRNGPVTPQINDYTWAQIDKTSAYINDLADVITTGVSPGDILKWNGTTWFLASDETNGGLNSIVSTNITDGTIINADINSNAAITQSKILGLPAVVTQVNTNQTNITNKATKPASNCNGTNKLQWDGSTFTCAVDSGSVTKGNLTEITSSILTINGGTEAVIGAGTSIQVQQADTDSAGYLSDTDWDTFNNKQNALTNPITGTGGSGQVAYFSGATLQTSSGNLTFDETTLAIIGNISASGNVSASTIQQDVFPNTDHSATGNITDSINGGADISQMRVCYLKSDGEWWFTSANDLTTLEGELAITLENGTDGNPLRVALSGSYVRDDTWSWTPGAPVYLSTTLGQLTQTKPELVRKVGTALSASVIKFEPKEREKLYSSLLMGDQTTGIVANSPIMFTSEKGNLELNNYQVNLKAGKTYKLEAGLSFLAISLTEMGWSWYVIGTGWIGSIGHAYSNTYSTNNAFRVDAKAIYTGVPQKYWTLF